MRCGRLGRLLMTTRDGRLAAAAGALVHRLDVLGDRRGHGASGELVRAAA